MSNFISVIVPVYNVKNYLSKCVESLLDQSFINYEIILVDDGSTDGSQLLCDEYSKKYENVTCYHKTNGGLSDARNYGIKKSRGDYLVFVDSDDFVSKNHLECLYKAIKDYKVDISICDIVHCYSYDDVGFSTSDEYQLLKPKEAIIKMFYQKDYLVTACGKMFSRHLFDSVLFPINTQYEDVAVMYKLFEQADTISYNTSKIYAYFHRDNSITTSNFNEKDLDIIKICNDIRQHYNNCDKDMNDAVTSYCSSAYLRVFLNAPEIDKYYQIKKECEKYLKENGKTVLFDKNSRRKNKYAILLYFVSPFILRKVYSHVDRWK